MELLADDPQRRRRVTTGGYIGTGVLVALSGLTGAAPLVGGRYGWSKCEA